MNFWKRLKENGNMKAMKKLIATASMAVFALAGCQDEQFEERVDSGNYYASVETFGSDTKTTLGEGRSVVWSAEDCIAVFEGIGIGQAYMIIDSYVGKSSGEFAEIENSVTEGPNGQIVGTIAVYPFSSDLSVAASNEGYEITGLTFPSEQKYVAGSFSDDAFPMAALAQSGSRDLSFKNIGGILKLSLIGNHSVSKITITGNSGEKLSGSTTVTLGSNGIPTVRMADDASETVTLLCDEAVQLSENTATEFYISIPPTKFEDGFTVTATATDSKTYTVATAKPNNVSRSGILAMPETNMEESEQEEVVERWVDLGLPSGILWAAYNVGATSPEEYGGYYAWGETEEKSSYTNENYKFYNSSTGEYDRIGLEISGTSYDVANVKWGEGARMPSRTDLQELVSNCTFVYGTYNGVTGNYVTGPNGKSIFLPFSGRKCSSGLINEESYGFFWSGTESGLPYTLLCFENYGLCDNCNRCDGHSVRPVKLDLAIVIPPEFYVGEYIDEYGINNGSGVKIGETVWAPVNCGYHKTDFPYGKLYQWGRKYGQGYSGELCDEYHMNIGNISDANLPTFADGGVTETGGNHKDNANIFYTIPSDWVSPRNDKLWNTGTDDEPIKTNYDPCPEGWRVPTGNELNELYQNYSSWTKENGQTGYWFSGTNSYSAKVPQIFLPAAGRRYFKDGVASSRGSMGYYWSSKTYDIYAYFLFFSARPDIMNDYRGSGYSVRCVLE